MFSAGEQTMNVQEKEIKMDKTKDRQDLEAAEGYIWVEKWRTTSVGKDFLNGQILFKT